MISIVLFLAIVGLGWETFFTGVVKGADKIGITPIVKNLTDSTKESITDLISESSSETVKRTLSQPERYYE
ncbi:MAG: hypothetical protein ACPKPY_12600 [Nitrososphaeraceae archaeon]